MSLFIMNKFGHYFVVESTIDTSKLDGCSCFDSLNALLEAAALNTECSVEELNGSEIRVLQHEDVWHESTHRGELIPIDDTLSIYDFLSEYEC
ncbi:MAG: hypothetical protein CBB95_17855 [Alteromonas sp. TMED35]|uniref:hypothetical protein n=1 Tax=uncultured Alteromonas sp. TaxID=179113 RepID=UPI000B6311DB|nr:MAG: hypothetical protein CBB95_17855 [Alteromonas sp. TMED35]|tara:strand:+ start:60779 stop:61057 length:279 start_codon:yes stop_codon:yes gene_type:complete